MPIIQPTRITADPAFVVGPVNRRLFGSFVEHMGRCVYTGIYEPDHPSADAEGFRTDVADLVRELGVTLLRYPGGNFVSNYVWENGVGPRADRPTTLDLAWRSLETHQVGTDDFLQWCERIGVPAMLAVNLGTRGLVEAVELLQYVNAEPGSQLADRRVKNGRVEPYAVRAWCLGNEMDGPWQVGHKTAEEYARLAEETGRAMRLVDPDLELVACGSSNSGMPTFGTWERVVLERCFDVVDHISAHAYYEPLDGDYASFLASAVDMERFIDAVVATADHVAAVRRSTEADHRQLRRVERLVRPALRRAGPGHRRDAPTDRGRLRRARRGGRRQPADHPAPAHRPGGDRLPGPAGQRDRADLDRARRTRLAADDLPPVRTDRPARPGHGAADPVDRPQRDHRPLRRRSTRCTAWRPGTRTRTPSPCSRSTVR